MMKSSLQTLLTILTINGAFAGIVVTDVAGFGFDSLGNPLTNTPVNGQEIYDATESIQGTWLVVSDNDYSQSQDQNNRNETSAISYTSNAKTNNTNGADSHSSSFSSFNAGADASDFVVVESETLAMSVSWTYRDMRWQRRDMTDATQSYNLSWTITSFDKLDIDLGNVTGDEIVNSLGVGEDFGFAGYVEPNTSGAGNRIVPVTFTGDTPNSRLEYSGSSTGQLTGKYDGTNFNLTLEAAQERDTNATTWNAMMNGDGDEIIGENPRGQLRAYLDADYDYTLTYTTYTFLAVPEPSAPLFLSLATLFALRRRRG